MCRADAIELSFSSGTSYTSNLLQDSSKQSVVVIVNRAIFGLFPSSTLSTRMSVSQFSFIDRSTFNYTQVSGEFWWLPLLTDGALGISLATQFSARFHSSGQKQFDRLDVGTTLGITRRWSPKFSTRSVIALNSIRYHNAASGNRISIEAIIGANVMLSNRNTIDITFSGGTHSYRFLDRNFLLIDPIDPSRSLTSGFAGFLATSLRWSRPISDRTGVALTLRGEKLVGTQDRLLFGASTGYLTPWNDLIDRGESSIQLKSYAIPRVVSILYFSGERRWFHAAVENSDVRPIIGSRRQDDRLYVNLLFKIPLQITKSLFGRLTLTSSYSNTNSTLNRYNFNSWDSGILFELEL